MVRHVVLMKFAEAGIASEAAKRLNALKDICEGVLDIEAGVDELHTPKSFDLAFIALFRDTEAAVAFDSHPRHLEVQQFIKAHPRTVFKADYTLK